MGQEQKCIIGAAAAAAAAADGRHAKRRITNHPWRRVREGMAHVEVVAATCTCKCRRQVGRADGGECSTVWGSEAAFNKRVHVGWACSAHVHR